MSSEKRPSFQFYPRDFLSDYKVISMNATQRGCYITLLCICWLEEELPGDLSLLELMANYTGPDFATEVWPRLEGCFFKTDKGKYRHKRLDEERRKQEQWAKDQSRFGRVGAEKRWAAHRLPIQTPMGSDGSSSSSSSSTSLKDKNIVSQALKIYETYKTKIRPGAREDAIRNISTLLRKGVTEAALLTAVANYADYLKRKGEDDVQFRIQANNFFGKAQRYTDFAEAIPESDEERDRRLLAEIKSGN